MCVLVKCVACFLCIKQYIITIRNEWDTLWLLKLCCMKELTGQITDRCIACKTEIIPEGFVYN